MFHSNLVIGSDNLAENYIMFLTELSVEMAVSPNFVKPQRHHDLYISAAKPRDIINRN